MLPLCTQYSCSCCDRTHALNLYRSIYGALEDAAFSRDCAAWLTTMACRVCDPEVGVGIKPDVCPGTCRSWHAACKDEFFSFDSRSHTLVPCPEGSTNSLLICSKLHTMAADGNELCELAGLTVARHNSDECFSGSSASSQRMDHVCAGAPPRSEQQQNARGSAKPKRKSKKSRKSGGPSDSVSLAAALGVIFLVFCPLVVLGRRYLLRGASLAAPAEEGPWAQAGQGHRLGTKQD